ncbi:unnamed protein product [Lota lota]
MSLTLSLQRHVSHSLPPKACLSLSPSKGNVSLSLSPPKGNVSFTLSPPKRQCLSFALSLQRHVSRPPSKGMSFALSPSKGMSLALFRRRHVLILGVFVTTVSWPVLSLFSALTTHYTIKKTNRSGERHKTEVKKKIHLNLF